MSKNRLEAFSDGVLAIIITVMLLGLRSPHGDGPAALRPVLHPLLSYLLSFVYIGIYWNNHHHLLQAAERVSGRVLWANLNLLFWLSLLPFATQWMGDSGFGRWPVVLYNVVLLLAGIAYFVLSRSLVREHGVESALTRAVGRDRKGAVSVLFYVLAVALSFIHPWIGVAVSVVVALIWVVPDRRIEAQIK